MQVYIEQNTSIVDVYLLSRLHEYGEMLSTYIKITLQIGHSNKFTNAF
jgi:hypothetical protein